jgi:IS5 family transposase
MVSILVGIAGREKIVVLVPGRRGLPSIVGELFFYFSAMGCHIESANSYDSPSKHPTGMGIYEGLLTAQRREKEWNVCCNDKTDAGF